MDGYGFRRIDREIDYFIFYTQTVKLRRCRWGFSEGVFPGVCLLSRCRWSGLPVDLAIRFGPGLMPIIFCF